MLDATVPGWRFEGQGPDAIATELSRWFRHPAPLEGLERRRTPDGEVVTYTVSWEEAGAPFAAHHCHVIAIASNARIARDYVANLLIRSEALVCTRCCPQRAATARYYC